METLFQILLFGGLIFLMMRFGCGSHMFGGKHGSAKGHGAQGESAGGCCGGSAKRAKRPATEEQHQGTPPAKDVDPVCGKPVSTEGAKSSLHDGLVYFFCSGECRETFEASPAQYAGRNRAEALTSLEHRPAEGGGHG